MSKVNLLLLKHEYMGNMYRQGLGFQLEVTREFRGQGNCYDAIVFGEMPGTLEDIADELFDLTNNPSRQEEREKKYGRGRSLSVGDIVEVDDKMLLCCSFGWKVV
jgi:hypothetical protein